MHPDHLRKYPERLILELLSKESYCQNTWLITATCVRKLLFFCGFCLFDVNYCFDSVHFIPSVPFDYVQNNRITYLLMGYQSLNLSWFGLEQYLLLLIINVWNNLLCNFKYIEVLSHWDMEKRHWRILEDIRALRIEFGHLLAYISNLHSRNFKVTDFSSYCLLCV